MQAAFVECDGYQCGYCTSGQIMSAVALLKEPCGPSDADVKELMSGNICPLRRLSQHRRGDPAGAATRVVPIDSPQRRRERGEEQEFTTELTKNTEKERRIRCKQID